MAGSFFGTGRPFLIASRALSCALCALTLTLTPLSAQETEAEEPAPPPSAEESAPAEEPTPAEEPASTEEDTEAAERGDRPEDPLAPIAPGEPGFLLERLTGGEGEEAVRTLPPPTSYPMPPRLLANPTPEAAFGAFQRGLYLTAMDLALPLAEEGVASAQTLVAEIFAEGFAVPRDMEAASFWYSQAAAGGDTVAEFKYGLMLMAGRHAPRDPERGRELMKKAAEAGHPLAQFNYGQILVDNDPGADGLMKALPYFEKSANQGIADAQYALAQIYINAAGVDQEKREEARHWLRRAALAGYDTAQLDMGVWLIDGIGGEVDYENGFAWMQRAANGGNVLAQNKLAHLYINAIGTRPDPVEAGKWYVLSRRAGLNDPALQDFFRGLTDEEKKQAIEAANQFRR